MLLAIYNSLHGISVACRLCCYSSVFWGFVAFHPAVQKLYDEDAKEYERMRRKARRLCIFGFFTTILLLSILVLAVLCTFPEEGKTACIRCAAACPVST